MSLVGSFAPDFIAPAIMEDGTVNFQFHFNDYRVGAHTILFFYPLNFCEICANELLELSRILKQLHEKETLAIAISTDSYLAHQLFRKRLSRSAARASNSPETAFDIPLVSDINKSICENYKVLPDHTVPLRATFFIDKEGIIRYQQVQEYPVARNTEGILGFVQQFTTSK